MLINTDEYPIPKKHTSAFVTGFSEISNAFLIFGSKILGQFIEKQQIQITPVMVSRDRERFVKARSNGFELVPPQRYWPNSLFGADLPRLQISRPPAGRATHIKICAGLRFGPYRRDCELFFCQIQADIHCKYALRMRNVRKIVITLWTLWPCRYRTVDKLLI